MSGARTTTQADAAIFDRRLREASQAVCDAYGIDSRLLRILEMSGVNGGLGNAIPLPVPFRRRYVVRYHRCMREADDLALRGLFAHELMHVLHYVNAGYGQLLVFMARYAAFGITAAVAGGMGRGWVQQLEHLTDLMAVRYGEGPAIAAWKRFKDAAIARGDIRDSWADLYLSSAQIDALHADDAALQARIGNCVRALRAPDPLRPFARIGT